MIDEYETDPFMVDVEQPVKKHDIFDDTEERPTVTDAAISYAQRGMSIVPCALPGKYPPMPWMTYQAEIADEQQIRKWYTRDPQWGLGLVCGDISGGLEVIDLDGGAFANKFDSAIRLNAPGLLERLIIETTPSGGRHYAYRCEEVEGNTAIAKTTAELPGHKRGADGLTTLIETRGQGGYIVVYPTRGYCMVQGSWEAVPTITREERNLLWGCASMFDESDKAQPVQKLEPRTATNNGKVNADKANELRSILEAHGWTMDRNVKDHQEWWRPGKEAGVSATWNYIDDSFYVFSSNAAPFQQSKRYTLRQVKALLEPESVPLHERPLEHRYKETDADNGRRFADRYHEQFKHSKAWGWLSWNGYKWERNADVLVMDAARNTARMILDEAIDANPDEVKRLGKWAIASLGRSKLDSMLYLASTESDIRATPGDFDTDNFTLNSRSGVIDLHDGRFFESNPVRMLSKAVATEYDSCAPCPRWLSFLDRIMDGNRNLIDFLQRAIGYSLTGSTVEQCFFLCYGTGANGKSVFLETMRGLLDDYAAAAEFSAFLATASESVRNDIAALAGARFVSANESGADKRLSESIIKALTGGDTISARFLFHEYFEFRPQFKVWMATNHKPIIKDTDHAIWRRVRLVPFNVTIPEDERDPHLTAKLREEFPGILNWAIQGCMEWQRIGLGTPVEVTQATNDYRNEQDSIGSFVEGYCVIKQEARYSAAKLHKLYVEMTGDKVSAKEFNRMMTEHGYKSEHSRTGTVWVGLGAVEYDGQE